MTADEKLELLIKALIYYNGMTRESIEALIRDYKKSQEYEYQVKRKKSTDIQMEVELEEINEINDINDLSIELEEKDL